MFSARTATAAVAAIMAMVAVAFVAPAMADPSQATTPSVASAQGSTANVNGVAVGKSFTLTSIEGGYRVVGDASQNGTATGSLNLSETGTFRGGYTLAVSSGTLSFAGQSFQIGSGSAEMGPRLRHAVGQAQVVSASISSAVLLFGIHSLGNFGGNRNAVVQMDLKSGTTEYIVRLLVTVT